MWVDRATAPGVTSCTGELLVHDALRHETVWFGRAFCRQTWTWNGATWTQRSTPVAPPASVCSATFDSARSAVVAVFGNHSTGLETWEWDGTAWQLRQTGGLPGRFASSMAFDAARNVTLLFGGREGSEDGFADTWTWNGTSWTQVWFGGPSPRWGAGMVYDAQRQRVVLFGGEGPVNGTTSRLGDTWEWNGSYWFNHYGIAGPAPRIEPRLEYDSRRQRTLLIGGVGSNPFQETWQWNGSAWTQLTPAGTSPAVPSYLAYDPARDIFVTLANGTTWEYVPGNLVPATFTTYGAGCASPVGVPQLSNVPGSLPRIGSTLQLRLTNLPPSFFNVPLGFLGFDANEWSGMSLPLSLTPLGFTGCDALLAPIRTDGLTNVSGTAAWNIALPMTALALGVDVYFQGAVFVPGWSPGGFAFTNGGHAVVGSP
ncbi:MAG: hypothetical protein WAT39_03405 [Planctomycetota bacterium]